MRDLLVKLSLGGLGARHAPPGSIGLLKIVAHSRQKKNEELCEYCSCFREVVGLRFENTRVVIIYNVRCHVAHWTIIIQRSRRL